MRWFYGLYLFFLAGAAFAQEASVSAEAYRRAESYLPQNIGRLALDLAVRPTWSADGRFFWYRQNLAEGWRYLRIDVPDGKSVQLFDHERLAAELVRQTGRQLDARHLSFEQLRVAKDGSLIAGFAEKYWHIEAGGAVREIAPTHDDSSSVSPDGKWQAFVRGGNVFLRDTASNAERALTDDGSEQVFYARALPNPAVIRQGRELIADGPADVAWSPDSTRLATYRIDASGAGRLTLVQSKPADTYRPRSITYHYPLTGDATVPLATAHVFQVPSGRRVDLRTQAVPILYYYGLEFQWRTDSRHVLMEVSNRGWNELRLLEADADTGTSREVVSERSSSFIPNHRSKWQLVDEWSQYLWVAEKGGWPHLQLLDAASGKVQRQLTHGSWAVVSVPPVEAASKVIFVVGSGRESSRDPYLRHLYRVSRSGGELRLLTPEPVDHEVHLSPDGRWFVDNMSRADLPTRSVLRSARDGAIVHEISRANIEALTRTGFVMPEPFEALAADGKTPIHGVIYRPANFRSDAKLPMIDNIYTGPHYVMAPKSFDAALRGRTAGALAQTGFAVVLVDGRGTSGRSRAFLDAAYQRLGAVGLDDHEAGLRQLAQRYPYLDIDRVGIYGFSAGGFDAARALFHKPDFYKVGVAASGNHDHRSDKASWNEMWMGYPLAEQYDRESNLTWAKQLRGKLLLAHGELDENVNPMATLQLVGALIDANKDFDLLILPNRGHYLDESPYYLRRQWDFFVRNLLGAAPPAGYAITPFSRSE